MIFFHKKKILSFKFETSSGLTSSLTLLRILWTWEIQQFQRKVDTCVIGSLLCYKKCSRAEQSLATLRGESKISCAASVNNKPTFSPCSFISRWKSHSCSLLWSRGAQSKCLGDASPLLVLGVGGPEQAGEAARDSVHGDDDVASQCSASACPRAERSSWKKKVSVTLCLRFSVVAGICSMYLSQNGWEVIRNIGNSSAAMVFPWPWEKT